MAGSVKKFAPEIDAGLYEEMVRVAEQMGSRSVISSKRRWSITFTTCCHLSTLYRGVMDAFGRSVERNRDLHARLAR